MTADFAASLDATYATPQAGERPRSIAALDMETRELERRIAARRVEESVAKLRYLLAHPQEFAAPAEPGLLAEYRHLLYDADPDSTTRPFVDLTKGIYTRPGGAK